MYVETKNYAREDLPMIEELKQHTVHIYIVNTYIRRDTINISKWIEEVLERTLTQRLTT